MRIKNFLTMLALSLAVPCLAFADSNATGGGVVNSESIFLGAGPFDHGSGLGSPLNTVASLGTFTGGFNANYMKTQGECNGENRKPMRFQWEPNGDSIRAVY